MSRDAVLAALVDDDSVDGLTVAELAQRTGGFHTSTYSELCRLERAGKVRRLPGRGRDERFEALPEEPQP